MVERERIPDIGQLVAMMEYTEAKMAAETNPLAIHMLGHHLRNYFMLADEVTVNFVKEKQG